MFFALFKEIRKGVNPVHHELIFCLPNDNLKLNNDS